MQDYEKLGAFYLGKVFDPDSGERQPNPLLFDARDLTTHGVCVGMTGSGKTGLCLTLLEEAAIDGIPAIAIDPKGDLGNLMLTFPELRPSDFRPWVDPGEATRQGLTPDQLAERVAETWRKGLADWDQEPARIARFRDSVDIAIYTPGSNAGLPLTILRSLSAPSAAILQDSEALRERIAGATSGLLALVGVDADPLRSREHILLASILDRAWRSGASIDLGGVIRAIQSPPFDKVGVMDLESFFPAKERFEFSLTLNNLMASPGFSAWTTGEPLDIQRLLYTAEGKPRLSILSIAHLSDAERMFFVTILLNEIIAWMRAQPGTTSLRALLYMDEVFGYFPPTANPPSKTPMLTLLKQARAFGLGVMLATQNPVDLDYKGLSNAGAWFIGRLQTERDKARLLDGLEGASASAGVRFDRRKMETILSGLGQRVFLLNNVHEDEPVVFQTRWCLSYLRGPLARDQIESLMRSRRGSASGAESSTAVSATIATSAASVGAPPAGTSSSAMAVPAANERPILPPDVPQTFLPRRKNLPAGAKLVYRPTLVGTARIHFAQAASQIDFWENVTLTLPAEDGAALAWDEAEIEVDAADESESEPEGGALFAELPPELSKAKKYATLATALKDHLYRTRRLTLFKNAALKKTSKPSESEGDFRASLALACREERDLQVEKLRAKYAPKLATLQEQVRRAEQRVEKEKSQAHHQTFQAVINVGTSVLGALFGRKLVSSANLGRAATSVRSAGKIARERADVGQAEETVEAIQRRLADLEAEFKSETEEIQASFAPESLSIESIELQPKKADISVSRVVLGWSPTIST